MGFPRLMFVVVLLLGGCSFEWNDFDPRLEPQSGGTGGVGIGGSGGTRASDGGGPIGGDASTGGDGNGGSMAEGGGSAAGGQGGQGGQGGVGATGGTPILGLVASWPLDEGSGNDVFDATANGYDGTIASPLWVPGVNGTALRFEDDSQVVIIPVDQAFDRVSGGAYTLTAWFKLGSGTFDHSGLVAVKWGPGFGSFYGLEPHFAGGEWRFNLYDGDSHAGETAVPLTEGTWSHLAATVENGTTLRLYFDGAEVSMSTTVDTPESAVEVLLGTAGGYVPSGDLDQVRFYDRALTDTEILTDMQQ